MSGEEGTPASVSGFCLCETRIMGGHTIHMSKWVESLKACPDLAQMAVIISRALCLLMEDTEFCAKAGCQEFQTPDLEERYGLKLTREESLRALREAGPAGKTTEATPGRRKMVNPVLTSAYFERQAEVPRFHIVRLEAFLHWYNEEGMATESGYGRLPVPFDKGMMVPAYRLAVREFATNRRALFTRESVLDWAGELAAAAPRDRDRDRR